MKRTELKITLLDLEELMGSDGMYNVTVYISNGVIEEECFHDGEACNLSDLVKLSDQGHVFKLDGGGEVNLNNSIKFYLDVPFSYEAVFYYVLGSSVIYEYNFDMVDTQTVCDLNEFLRTFNLLGIVRNPHLNCVSLSKLFPNTYISSTDKNETFLFLDDYELRLVDIEGSTRDITEGALVGVYGSLVIFITKDWVGFITSINNVSKVYKIYGEGLFEPNPIMHILKNLVLKG
jgi:hypothetical protein